MRYLRYIIILFAVTFAACDDEEKFAEYANSPIKSVACVPLFFPQPVSEGAVISVIYTDNVYNFIKINSDGTYKTTPLSFTWSSTAQTIPMPGEGDENQPVAPQNPDVAQHNISVDLSEGTFHKNSSDEYYLDYYSSNDFGNQYFAVVKIDKDCNILFQIDSTVNAMGGGGRMGEKQSVTKFPTAGTPLNNGGYAMILKAPNMGMFQNSDYNLILRIIDSQGKYVADHTLEFSENIKIVAVTNANNNIAIYYQISDNTCFYNVYTEEGELINKVQIESNSYVFDYIAYHENVLLSCYNYETQQFYLQQVNENGGVDQTIDFDQATVLCNISEIDGKRCLAGFTTPDVFNNFYTSTEAFLQSIDNLNGLIIPDIDNQPNETIITDYNNGVVIYAVFKDANGTYTIFLTQLTPVTHSNLGDNIYIYRTDDLKKLEVN